LVDEIRFLEPELYRQGISAWVELLSARLRDGIANGSVRSMNDAEIAAQAHFLVGARRFLEDLVVEVGREEEVVDAYLGLVRHGLGAAPARLVDITAAALPADDDQEVAS
jgi:hypothetical protein